LIRCQESSDQSPRLYRHHGQKLYCQKVQAISARRGFQRWLVVLTRSLPGFYVGLVAIAEGRDT